MKTMPEYLMWIAFAITLVLVLTFIYYTYKPLDTEFFKIFE
jgi:hypothetical protein